MATPALNVEIHKPQIPPSEESTKDAPAKKADAETVSDEDKKKVIDLIQRYKLSWFWRRRSVIKRVLKAKEFAKGNQFIGFDPDSFQWFDAIQEAFNTQEDTKINDLDLYKFATNFFQMLMFAFIAALSAQVPKSRFLPKNAERDDDIETAKAASTIQEIIERANRVKSLHKQGLLELWTSGCYFKHTRYLVDSDRAGTHKETTVQVTASNVLPARFVCSQCGEATPADQMQDRQAVCPNCGTPFSDQDFYPEENQEIPVAQEEQDVPNGMVLQTIYGPMHVDCDPEALNLRETPILNLEQEVSIAWLRTSFPDFWKKLKDNTGGSTPESTMDRLARQAIFASPGSRQNYMVESKPTYSRTWVQNWAFAFIDDQTLAEKLQKKFPNGCMVAHVGDMVLDIHDAKLTDEWTWCGTIQESYGLYPPAVGDAAIPVQERINDMANLIHEYMDRMACGMVLVNESMLDTKNLNGKPMLPGVLNGVPIKKGSLPNQSLADAIVQIKAEMDAAIYQYVNTLKQDMELLVGTPPQLFGAGTQQGVETKGGQAQQLSQAMGKLGLYWDNIREEFADAAEIGVKCAARNMTDDWISVVTDETKEFRNEYVRIDQMKGSVHAEPETDQGFPMTWAEIKDFWMSIIESNDSMMLEMLFSDPENVDAAIRSVGVPGLNGPGQAMRIKTLRYIDKLLQDAPVPGVDPMTGAPILTPSIMPSELDDLDVAIKQIKVWAQKNDDKLQQNPKGAQNLLAFYKVCVSKNTPPPMPQGPGAPGPARTAQMQPPAQA